MSDKIISLQADQHSCTYLTKEKTMSKSKSLIASFCLILVLAASALAGEIQSPPCSPPDLGEIQSPPCSTAQLTTDDPTNAEEPEAPPAAEAIAIGTIAEVAVGAFLSVF
jgi:hypothetical protein